MTSLSIDLDTINEPREWFESLEREHQEWFEEQGYACVCKMHGDIVGLYKFLFTTGIVVGMDETGYKYRYCYHTDSEAFTGLLEWILEGSEEPAGCICRNG